MPVARFQMPDGRIARFEVPDGTTPEQAQAMIAEAVKTQPPVQKPGAVQQALGDLGAGAIRGAGSIGATLLTPVDALARAAGVQNSFIGRTDRRQAMDDALKSMGFDTDSTAFGVGKLGAEIAGTAGIGGALGQVATKVAPQVATKFPALLEAITTSGMKAGGATGAAGLGARTVGGGITGGLSAAAINPEDAAIGAATGAALPGVLQGAGRAGQAVGSAFKNSKTRAAEKLAEALDMTPQALAAKLKKGGVELVPGSRPTVGQILQSPQANALEKTVSQSPGGAALKQRYAEQNAARLAALEGVAPVDPRGLRSIQDDFGASALKAIKSGDEAARARTREAYGAVPQDETALYLPDFRSIADKYFPAGSFGGRSAVDQALATADDIGMLQLPGITATRSAGPESLATAVRRAGGITRAGGLAGEVRGLQGQHKNIMRNSGRTLDDLAESMAERGFIGDESADSLIEALNAEARGRAVYSADTPESVFRAMSESAMGDAPGASAVPQKVTMRQLDALRKSIGNAQRGAVRDPERATEAAALSEMKRAIDDRINQVVSGDGAVDEVLPLDWANKLTEAQALKKSQVEKFRTGPQAQAFLTGSDNLPKVQGGEFARYAWSNRAGAAADTAQLQKAIGEHPEVMRQFRSMVTTEGASTATAGGDLTGKFVRWVDNSLPGMKEVFDADQVKAMQRIAADIKRAERATAQGAAKGSDTFQKASQALDIGLLDSAVVNMAANRIPLVGQFTGPLLEGLRQNARRKTAGELAGLLANPSDAAGAMGLLSSDPVYWPLIQQGLLRLSPAVAADR